MKLDNKVAIVTGASRGIGKCIAIKLAEAGTHLALIARSEHDLKTVAYTCEQYGVTVKIFPFDLSHIQEIPKLVQDIKKSFGHVDVLINDAGRYQEADPFADDLKTWDATLDLNFKAPYHLTNEVLKVFSLGEESAVINISSISGLTVTGGGEIYNASKAALKSFGGCLFEDVRERGIKVTNIYPGYVNTSMTSESDADHEKMIQPQDVASAVLWALQMPGNACPTDITIRPQKSPTKKAA